MLRFRHFHQQLYTNRQWYSDVCWYRVRNTMLCMFYHRRKDFIWHEIDILIYVNPLMRMQSKKTNSIWNKCSLYWKANLCHNWIPDPLAISQHQPWLSVLRCLHRDLLCLMAPSYLGMHHLECDTLYVQHRQPNYSKKKVGVSLSTRLTFYTVITTLMASRDMIAPS